jgi:hypothetical protein
MHIYALILFAILACLSSWWWTLAPTKKPVLPDNAINTLPEGKGDQPSFASPEYDLSDTGSLRVE